MPAPWLSAFAGAAAVFLLVNFYTEAAVRSLAEQTGQLFAGYTRYALALAFLAAGALSTRRGVARMSVTHLAWGFSVAQLFALPRLHSLAAVMLECNRAPPASQLALAGRFTAAALHSVLPAAYLLSRLLRVTTSHQLATPVAIAISMRAALIPPIIPLPWPKCTAPALAAVVAATAACISGSRGRISVRYSIAGLALVASIAAAQVSSCTRCVHRVPSPGSKLGMLWSCELRHGGRLGILEGMHLTPAGDKAFRYRLMRLGHSVMGGQWVEPPDVAGQSIYTAFHVQQVPRLLRPGGARSLHVGLGAGTAVAGMQRRGVLADVVELHPEIIQAAAAYFNVTPLGRSIAGDAGAVVETLAAEALVASVAPYDYVILDVFAGGISASRLGSPAFFARLKALLVPGGVLAVNVYSLPGAMLDDAACRLLEVFAAVRCFGDLEEGLSANFFGNAEQEVPRNFVLAASDGADFPGADVAAAVAAEAAAEAGGVIDRMEYSVFEQLAAQEVDLGHLSAQWCAAAGRAGGWRAAARRWAHAQALQAKVALAHWRVMRAQFGDRVWAW